MKLRLLFLSLLCSGLSFAQTLNLEPFAEGFTNITEIVNAGDQNLYVAEQGGVIRILNADGTIAETPFLDISSLVSTGDEQGLLGLAFHHDYENSGHFFINYTNLDGDTVIARYARSASDPNIADSESAMIFMTIDQPDTNHNGGCLRFGPDDYLYISMGDGGGAGDPQRNGQKLTTLLGKMLRINVDDGTPYSIPADNPFAETDGMDEIWAYGLRNAWKFSFDMTEGDIWIADVGQGINEEINKIDATTPGANFGWRCYEGSDVYSGGGCTIPEGSHVVPIAQYTHASTGGCSITGGYVYRGTRYPNLVGKYLFADFCNDKIGMVNNDGSNMIFTNAFGGNNFTAFGEDASGELYIGGKESGKIFKITDTSLSTKSFTGSSFAIYPNPAKGSINVKNGTDGTYAANVQVYDISGKLLLSNNFKEAQVNTIATNTLPAGFYMVKISDNNGTESSHKLVIE